MKFVESLSKTSLIVQDLTRRILAGHYPVGSKLPNMRALAKFYNVSIRIMHIAMKQLEEKRLLVLEHGKGAFVVNYKENEIIECYYLIWGVDITKDKYHVELTKLIYPPYRENGFYFTVRAVFDKRLGMDGLKKELSFIDMLTDVRCLLVNAVAVSPESLKLLEKQRCPVIFIGDSRTREMNASFSRQITGDNEMLGYNTVRFLRSQNPPDTVDEIDIIYPLNHYYHGLYLDGARRAGAEFGVRINHYDISRQFQQNSERKVHEFLESHLTPDGKLRHHTVIAPFSEDSENWMRGKLQGTPQDRMFITNSYYQEGMGNFYHLIFERIRHTVRDPQTKFKEIVPIPFMINNLVTGVSYGCQPDGRVKSINPDIYYTYY